MVRKIVLFAALLLLAALPLSAQETPTPITTTYQVRSGDTLGSIAARFGTTVVTLMRLNDISNSELVVIGQTLRIPVPGTPTPDEPTETATALPVFPVTPQPTELDTSEPMPPPTQSFDYGIEADFTAANTLGVAQQIAALGMHWAKIDVSWREIEVTRGAPDFAQLDSTIDALEGRGLKILLTTSAAPDWSRSGVVENGPPDNFADFNTFVDTLAQRYVGRVAAYEIWNEPNLRREWNSPLHPIGGASYGDLLRGAYGTIKAADPAAIVVSAGLAPTGFDDGINAVDDRKFLSALYAYGLASISDAVGAHPFGFANPPDAVCCAAPTGVETHFGHPSFYFLDTLNDYHKIMLDNDDAGTLIWVTRFGWGTSEGMAEPPFNSQFVRYNSLAAQADYLPRAFELGAKVHFVGVMILFNLNSCVTRPDNAETCYYSLFDPTGRVRPAYSALATIFGTAIAR